MEKHCLNSMTYLGAPLQSWLSLGFIKKLETSIRSFLYLLLINGQIMRLTSTIDYSLTISNKYEPKGRGTNCLPIVINRNSSTCSYNTLWNVCQSPVCTAAKTNSQAGTDWSTYAVKMCKSIGSNHDASLCLTFFLQSLNLPGVEIVWQKCTAARLRFRA